MKRHIHAGCIAAILFILVLLATQAADISSGKAGPSSDSKVRSIAAMGVLIETYEDGKLTPVRLIADYLFVPDERGVWRGYWRHICITPIDEDKSVCLKVEMWSTESGDITSFQPFANGCAFNLAVGNLYGRRTLQLIVKEEGIKAAVRASGLWYSEVTQTEFKKE